MSMEMRVRPGIKSDSEAVFKAIFVGLLTYIILQPINVTIVQLFYRLFVSVVIGHTTASVITYTYKRIMNLL